MSDNPYAAPAASLEDLRDPGNAATTVRRDHLRRELGLRAIGSACLLLGAFFLLTGGMMGRSTLQPGFEDFGVSLRVEAGLLLAIGLFALVTGWGYFLLRPWVRIPGGLVAVATLLISFFLATPIVAYAAYLTFSAKGRRVLSPDYAAVRAATPQLSAWRHPAEALVLLGLLSLYLGAIALVFSNLPAD